MPYEYNPDDKFGYKDTLPENHPEKVITGVEFDDEFKKIAGAIDSLEDATTGDGQFVDAPSDGQLYGRKDRDWEAISDGSNDWSDIENKPTEFPPSPHTHPWGEITDKPSSYPPGPHDHDGQYVEEAPNDGKQYVRESEAWAEVDIPEGDSSVHIGENPPDSPQEGQQWMEVPASGDATMWIYDGANWLQQPGGKDGADGADGTNGSDGLWTDNGGGSISYDGAVTVTGDLVASKSDSGADALAIGVNAGATSQGANSVAVGLDAAHDTQGVNSVAIGNAAGRNNQGNESLSLGCQAGYGDQGAASVAIGFTSGYTSQGDNAVSVGNLAGFKNQSQYAVSVGHQAGKDTQGNGSVAIGGSAGYVSQSDGAVAIGPSAGENNQGSASIAIGKAAGQNDQAANSIVISATGQSSSLSYAGVSIEVPGAYLNYNGSDEWRFAGGNVVGGGLRFDSIVQDGSPVIDAKGLITALTTLRNATMDETQDIRESLRSAIDELVAGFEQEIAAMPAGGPQ